MSIIKRHLAIVLLLHLALPLAAGVPQIINYQGKVSVGITPFTGTGQFRFALVDATGTTSYWSNDGTGSAGSAPAAAVQLPVVNGIYVVPLGDTAIANMSAVPATVFTNDDVRLRVWFNDGTNGSQLLAPDQRVTSVGYAMMAAAASTVTAQKLSANPAAAAPANAGTVYFNTAENLLYYSDGTEWIPLGKSQAAYRWAVWSTYNEASGWFFNNETHLTGGVAVSNWSDSNATAAQISADKKTQAALFNKKAAISPNSVVWADTWLAFSSTNGKFAGALFRVRNRTGAAINWPLYFYATAYPAWGEKASIALNGVDAWNTAGDSGATTNHTTTLSIPANRISTVICVAAASPVYTPSSFHVRSTVLTFRNNCLTLPAGLEFVDDLDTATGGYEQ